MLHALQGTLLVFERLLKVVFQDFLRKCSLIVTLRGEKHISKQNFVSDYTGIASPAEARRKIISF